MDVNSVLAAVLLSLLAFGFLGVSIALNIRPIAPYPNLEGRESRTPFNKIATALVTQLVLLIVSVIAWSIAVSLSDRLPPEY